MTIRLSSPYSRTNTIEELRRYLDELVRDLEGVLSDLEGHTKLGTTIQNKSYNAADWTTLNPVLMKGEIGFETDTNKMKVGTGADDWTSLPYVV